MQRIILTSLSILIFLSNTWTQETYKQENSKSADSLINEFKTKRCEHLISSIEKFQKKTSLDRKLISFRNDFYNKDLTSLEINNQLLYLFRQVPWCFDEITESGDFIKYEGRIRSYGNIEAFIGFVVQNEKVIFQENLFSDTEPVRLL